MLLRLFDREDLQLIPMIEFAAPLPKLEALPPRRRRRHRWNRMDRRRRSRFVQLAAGQSRTGAVLQCARPASAAGDARRVAELISRYARHPSLTGVAVRLSADGYAQLPGPDWGLDDGTIARFEHDAKLQVPGSGPQRFAQRSAFLGRSRNAMRGSNGGRCNWPSSIAVPIANWRRFGPAAGCIWPGRNDRRARLERDLRPTLPHPTTVASALLRIGIDARHYRDEQPQIVLLRPERIAAEENLGSRAADLEIGQMADIDRYFQALTTSGSLFFHPARESHIESFDHKSPFKPAYMWMLSEPSLSGQQNRRRLRTVWPRSTRR